MRRIASASSCATETTLNLPEALASSESGIEFVTTTSVRGESLMRSTAGPDRTGWGGAGGDAPGALLHQGVGRVHQGAGGVDEVDRG